MKNLILFIICFIVIEKLFATGQEPDYLIIEKDTFMLFSNPLEPYLDSKESRTINGIKLKMTNTGCWRGYIATWKIQNDSLFLIEIKREWIENKKNISEKLDLINEFGSNQVFAKWYTGTILSPRGNQLMYEHMGYLSIHETEISYKINAGIIKSYKTKTNLKYNSKFLYPSEEFLYDTLRKIITSNLDSDIIKQCPDSSCCFINIKFNNRQIESIELSKYGDNYTLFAKTILETAKNSFSKLPPLMKVNHKYYSSPYIQLFFHSYCIKNPWDKEYGCR